ncbi:hypothetical protein IC619_011950 [Hazenella sp. IB182353]|uniref:DUF6687 family protein n=1 Tax=Polycladospora coralii TaxID=2771432 RepID=UPI001747112B|nr:DUF6687 family protein [Polycladospora coralii]MBS7531210.1 hypothetical protein [Polycladospora coralii]
MNFYLIGSQTERPHSQQTIFVDGSPDQTFREGIDIELSHWIPNRTPAKYKADTSTEICIQFIEQEPLGEWDLAINNHLDVDGILSLFVLVHRDTARIHKKTLIEAAAMGDFWAWGSRQAQILFQGLTLFMNELRVNQADIQVIYERCFAKTLELLADDGAQFAAELAHLEDVIEQIETGVIQRKVYHERFVHYHVPFDVAKGKLDSFLHIPSFNAPLQLDVSLPPQARYQYDSDKVHLVSIATEEGYHYDLWYPGYMWADTPTSWRAPGFHFTGSTNGYYFGYAPLEEVVKRLSELETGAGVWEIASQLTPFSSIAGRNYPVVVSYKDGLSEILPQVVAEILSTSFSD